MKSLLYILLGFIFGHGSMFLVQTYLITYQEFEMVASIGIGLGLLSLVQWVSDGGGVFITSKFIEENSFQENFLSFVLARVIISSIFSSLIMCLSFTDLFNDNINSIINLSPFVGIIWACNLTGLADNKEKNKYLGPLSGLPWLLSSIAMISSYHWDFSFTIIGASYTAGLMILLFLQYVILRKELLNIGIPKIEKCNTIILKVMQYNMAYVSAQGYARAIPIIVDNLIGQNIAGVYIYAKNFINAFGQLIIYTRRVEFSKLVNLANDYMSFITLIKVQKLSFLISSSTFIIFTLVYFLVKYFNDANDGLLVLKYISILAGLQIFWVFSSSYGQLFVAKGMLKEYSLVISLSSFLCMVLILSMIGKYEIHTVFIAEMLMFIIQIYFYRKIYYNYEVK